MANSGIYWIDYTFNLAVCWLYAWAKALGITYEEINVWLFCIAWPLLTIAMAAWIVVLLRTNRRLRSLRA
jgi:hypothetical protein